MSFGPTKDQARACPGCHAAIPLASMKHCPVCGVAVDGPGDVGKALVEAMTDVLSDPLGKRKKR